LDGHLYFVTFVRFQDVGPTGNILVKFRILLKNLYFYMELIPIICVDCIELIVTIFKAFGGRFARQGHIKIKNYTV